MKKEKFGKDDLVALLKSEGPDRLKLFEKAKEDKLQHVGNKVYFRGLIEYSNRCRKNCYYCGIRAGNRGYVRYRMTDEEVLEAVRYSWENQYASIVIQSGEQSGKSFIDRIESLLTEIRRMTAGKIHVTLSLGEQSIDTYRRWFEAGAHRYLLRIEVSNPALYRKLHPANAVHAYNHRITSLLNLRETGYQVGTGVMIGLPFQTLENLADDLLFFQTLDIDMCGMGPFIEHEDTPLFHYKDQLL
ncbi:MAG TPA: radical SAM protein, partial [Bacteroidales bacterium]|nr:radical SAM protein [Bacteroidales bacterium]